MVKGDLVLITFPFTNLRGSKLRPALLSFTQAGLDGPEGNLKGPYFRLKFHLSEI